MIKLIGIFNIVFLVTVMGFIISRSKGFSFKKGTLSQLVRYTKLKTLFKFTLFVFSVNQIILCILAYLQFKDFISFYSLLFFIVGGSLLCLASLFTVAQHPYIHVISAIFSGAFVLVGLITYSLALVNIDAFLAYLLLLVTVPIPIIFLFKKKFKSSYWEVSIFLLIFMCNLIITLFLYK